MNTLAPVDLPFLPPADIVLDLPTPPSTNAIWRSVRSRVIRSRDYLVWMEQADLAVLASRQYPRADRRITGPFELRLVFKRGRGDLDNRIKAICDWLQSRAIIRNDKDLIELHACWGEAPVGVRVTVSPRA